MTYTADRSTVHRFEPVSHVSELVVGAIGAVLVGAGTWLSAAASDATWRILWWTGRAEDLSAYWSEAFVSVGLVILAGAFGLLTHKQVKRDRRASGGVVLAAFFAIGLVVAAAISTAF